MIDKQPLIAEIKRVVTFGLVGLINTAVTAGIMWLSEILAVPYPIYTTYAYIAGIICSYSLNRILTFRSPTQAKVTTSLLKFVIVTLCLLGLVQLIQFGLIEVLHLPKTIGIIIGMIFYTALGYLANRLWVFRVERNKHETS